MLGIQRKKCVVVDLDNTLWPGVLAETGAPFAWEPSISGAFSFVGIYFGLHEALLCLKRRGIVLACVSKNDEAVVRELWKYPASYPRERLLTLDDFVTHRINWNDKTDNIRSIAGELGFGLDTLVFVDDNPVERERVRQRLPEVEVWGEDISLLRRALLDDPRLQVVRVTDESSRRTELVKAQLGRQRLQTQAIDEQSYIESLQIKMRVERLTADSSFDRVEELFRRTTQFNATSRVFPAQQLRQLAATANATIFALHVSDRFAEHGLVGATIIEGGVITGLVISCRVLGLGIEHRFVQQVLRDSGADHLTATIVPTARNLPVRNIYRDNGFVCEADHLWRWQSAPASSTDHLAMTPGVIPASASVDRAAPSSGMDDGNEANAVEAFG